MVLSQIIIFLHTITLRIIRQWQNMTTLPKQNSLHKVYDLAEFQADVHTKWEFVIRGKHNESQWLGQCSCSSLANLQLLSD